MEPVNSFDQAVRRLRNLESTLMDVDNNELPAKVLEFETAYNNLLQAFNKSLEKPVEDLPEEVQQAIEALNKEKLNSDLAKMPQVVQAVEQFSDEVSKIQVYYAQRSRKVTESEEGGGAS